MLWIDSNTSRSEEEKREEKRESQTKSRKLLLWQRKQMNKIWLHRKAIINTEEELRVMVGVKQNKNSKEMNASVNVPLSLSVPLNASWFVPSEFCAQPSSGHTERLAALLCASPCVSRSVTSGCSVKSFRPPDKLWLHKRPTQVFGSWYSDLGTPAEYVHTDLVVPTSEMQQEQSSAFGVWGSGV